MDAKAKKARRSSLNMRGQRQSLGSAAAASALDPSIDTSQLYKLVGSDLPDNERLRQIVLWTLHRRRESLRSNASISAAHLDAVESTMGAVMAALKEKRVAIAVGAATARAAADKGALKPNPRNVELERSIAALEAQQMRLEAEKEEWAAQRRRIDALAAAIAPLGSDMDPSEAERWLAAAPDSQRALLDAAPALQRGAKREDQHLDVAAQIHQLQHFTENAKRFHDSVAAFHERTVIEVREASFREPRDHQSVQQLLKSL